VKVPEELLQLDEEKDGKKEHPSEPVNSMGPRDLFANKQITMITLILFVNWIACSLGYYGISLGIGDIGSDVFINFALVSIDSSLQNLIRRLLD